MPPADHTAALTRAARQRAEQARARAERALTAAGRTSHRRRAGHHSGRVPVLALHPTRPDKRDPPPPTTPPDTRTHRPTTGHRHLPTAPAGHRAGPHQTTPSRQRQPDPPTGNRPRRDPPPAPHTHHRSACPGEGAVMFVYRLNEPIDICAHLRALERVVLDADQVVDDIVSRTMLLAHVVRLPRQRPTKPGHTASRAGASRAGTCGAAPAGRRMRTQPNGCTPGTSGQGVPDIRLADRRQTASTATFATQPGPGQGLISLDY